MRLRTVSLLFVTALFLASLVISLRIGSVNSLISVMVVIRADGSVDPPSAPIQRNGDLYTLTGNITCPLDTAGIAIEKDDIVLDGNGCAVQGTGGFGYGIYMTDRSNVTVKNMIAESLYIGIYLYRGSHNTISANTMKANKEYAIYVEDSSNNLVSNNTVIDNLADPVGMTIGMGVKVEGSTNITISENDVINNNYGIRVGGSYIKIRKNRIEDNWFGITLEAGANNDISRNNITRNQEGFELYYSSSNAIIGNNITGNKWGMWCQSSPERWSYTSDNIFSYNIIANSTYGIGLRQVRGNEFYHNTFVNNTQHVYDQSWQDPQWVYSLNEWDDGYPSGGNYWSNYVGTDLLQGPDQNETGSDGIGDATYSLDMYNTDHYPLVYFIGLAPAYPTSAFSYSPTDPIASETTVTFDASDSSCSDGKIGTYYWTFGDGVHGWGLITTHKYTSYGNYNVTLTLYSSTRNIDNQTQSVTIRGFPAANFYYSPTVNASVGQSITLNASSSTSRGGTIVTYTWDFGDGNVTSTDNTIIIHAYPQGRTYNTTLTVLDSESLSSSHFKLVKVWMPTLISISTNASTTLVSFAVDIKGTLLDLYGRGLGHQTVVLYYTFAGANNWIPITSDQTDSLGRYNVNWVPTATGYFTLKAEWAGNSTHFATSNTVSLNSIAYQNEYIFSVESNSTVTAMNFESSKRELTFTVSGPSGTMGYADVYVAKTLIADIEGVEVKLNGTEINYTTTSLGDSWLIHFTYQHSVHSVAVNLGFETEAVDGGLPYLFYFIVGAAITALVIGILIMSRRLRRSQEKQSSA